MRGGVTVWGTARTAERLKDLAGNARFRPVLLDLRDAEAAEKTYRQANAEAGQFDCVIHNAGYGHFAPFAEESFGVWERQLGEMLTTLLRLNHVAFADMVRRGRGTLVNVSSLAVEFPLPFMAGYNVVKAGLSALSESLMFEARGSQVVIIDFRPGDYRTDFNRAMQADARVRAGPSRLASAWATLEANLAAAPAPSRAATDLVRAIRRGRSAVVRSGSFFQATLAPFLARLAPGSVRRAIAARYFGAS